MPLVASDVGSRIFSALANRYEHEYVDCAILQFEQSGASYLFDFASDSGATHEDRTIAAWTVTPAAIGKRDVAYQRGFPLSYSAGALRDRGHLIPYLCGGEVGGPNIFPQGRALNRGWSEQGRRFRALEREASTPGTFYFGHLLYEDDTAYPTEIEIGLIRGETLHVERFQNQLLP
jgi:hypothetical protein